MELLKHFFKLEKDKVGCKNVNLGPSFYKELCDPKNDFKQLSIFADVCIIFAIYSEKKGTIDIHSFDDVDTYKKIENSGNIIQISKPVNDRELKASEKDLKVLLKAVKSLKTERGYNNSDIIKQEELITFIKHPDGRPISQSKLSRMLNDRMECHIINIEENRELFKDLVQSISAFRNIL